MMTTTISNGRYILAEKLGDGGMGTVYKGIDTQTELPVAIKQLKPQIAEPENIARFLREAQALRDLNHPNIVTIMDSIDEGDEHYIVMEYVSGGDLAKLIKQGRLPAQEVVNLSIDLVDALTRAHRLEIIHRDIKPENVLVAEDKTLRLTDFGVARIRHDDDETEHDTLVGTLDYMPPEAFNNGILDARSDIWAFGVLLYEMLIGKNPFHAETIIGTIQAISIEPIPDIEELAPDAPPALIDLIYRMLERDPHSRIPSVRIVGAELEALLEGRATSYTKTELRSITTDDVLPTRIKHNIPAQTTAFVGREHELNELASLLSDNSKRLITLLAPGGMGKTRLAIEAAARSVNTFQDGVFFVELAPLKTDDSIPNAIAHALNLQIIGSPHDTIFNFLKDKNILLVLDNWEHLIDSAGLVTEILNHAPRITILATSRIRLGQMGETPLHLSGMDFPDWETPEDAMQYAAVKLFINSGLRAQPSFELTADNLDYVARICRLVQGMPLGIILAASWLGMLSPQEIAAELERSLDILADELGELPERQQSIRVVMDYAWQSMTEAEQLVFMKLSYFRGGFTRKAAQDVTGTNLRVLMSLVNKSLLRRDNETARYEIHELLRQFAAEKLTQSGLEDETRDAHMIYYGKFVVERYDKLYRGAEQFKTANEIEDEIENIEMAWLWAIHSGQAKLVDKMLDTLYNYFFNYAQYNLKTELFEAQDLNKSIERLSTMGSLIAMRVYMRFRLHQTQIHLYAGKTEGAEETLKNILAYAEQQGDNRVIHDAWQMLQTLYSRESKFDDVANALENRLISAEAMNDMVRIAYIYGEKSNFASMKGDAQKSLEYIEKSLEMHRDIENYNGLGLTQSNYAATLAALGRWEEAEKQNRELLEVTKLARNYFGISAQHFRIGQLDYLKGDFVAARQQLNDSLAISVDYQMNVISSASMGVLGEIEFAEGDVETARAHAYKARDFAEATSNMAYIDITRRLVHYVEYYADVEVDAEQLQASIYGGLKNYALLRRMEALLIIAHQRTKSGDFETATHYIAISLTHPLCPRLFHECHKPVQQLQNTLREKLGDEAYEKAWEEGAAMDFEETVTQLRQEHELEGTQS